MHVLVIDDDVAVTELFRAQLRACGHDVSVANDGPSALALAAATVPDVAFVDLVMPRMNGHELARRLRATPGLEHTLLVAVTGVPPGEGRGAPHRDFDLYLVKPVAREDLSSLLRFLGAGRA